MKKILFLLLIPFLFSDCTKEEPSLFRMAYQEDFEIAAGLNTFSAWYFEINNVETQKDFYLSENNIEEEGITDISPRSARLSTIFSNAEYDFIFRLSVRLYEDDVDDYQEVFYRENIPLNTTGTLDLIPTLVNVKRKMMEEEFNVVIRMEFRDSPPEFIETRLDMEFSVR